MDAIANTSYGRSNTSNTNATDLKGEQPYVIPTDGCVYLAMGLVGCVVNLLALAVVSQRRIIPGWATRWHLINQCVCNGLCCLFLSLKWIFGSSYTVPTNALGDFICMFWYNGRPFWICVLVSLLNTMSLSIEHFLSVVHPVVHRRFYTKRKLLVLFALNWLFSFAFQSIGMLQSERDGDECKERLTSPLVLLIWGVFVIIVNIVLPLPSILYCNIRMVAALLQHAPLASGGNSQQRRANSKEQIARDLTRTVIAVSCVLVICIFPDSFYFALYMLGLIEIDFNGWLYHLCEFLVNLHLTIDPFIYVLRMRTFKREMAKLCARKASAERPTPSTAAVSTVSGTVYVESTADSD